MMYTAAAAPGCFWLNLSGAVGTTNGTLSLSANGALVSTPGTYNCEVTVSTAGGGQAQNIYVSFIVTGVNLNTNPATLSFTYASDGSQPVTQSFAVVSDSGAAIPFTANAGCSWLSVSPAGGSAPVGSNVNVSVTVSPGNIAPGEYRCPVGISAPAAANRPELVVKLQVTSPPVVAPAQLLLTAVRGVSGPAARTIGISGPGTPSSFTASASADNGGGWLSLDTLSGAIPASVTVLADPSNLASGTYHGAVTISFADGQTHPLSVDVIFVVADLTMTAVPSTLTFRYQQGGTPPLPQVISLITSDGSAAKFTTAVTGPIRVTSGPATQSLTILPSATLAAGVYSNASVTITSAIAPTQQTVPVTIIVDPPAIQSPVLSLSAPRLTFSFTQGGTAGTQMLMLSNAGGGTLNITTSRSTNSGGDWLAADCTQVPIASSSPGLCTVTADPAKVIPDGMGSVAGTYSGQVAITTDVLGQYATVPVTLTLTPLPLIVLSSNGLTFNTLESGIAPPAGTIEISNSGPGTLNWTAEATTVIPGGAWLKLGASSGTANPTTPVSLQVTVDPTILPPGSPAGLYYGSVLISATDAATGQPAGNSPRIVTIVMTVGASGSHLSPLVMSSGLLFSAPAGTANVPVQAITVDTAGTTLAYSLIAVADDGGSWCSASPAAGTVHNSGTISVLVDFTNSSLLSGSTHTCDLRILFADGSLQNINVTALVTSPVCNSSNWLVSVNRPRRASIVPAYLPASWEVSVTDSCTGQPITAVNSLSLFFSNGDAPQQLTNRGSSTGIYSGSWTPTNVPANQARATVGIQAIANGRSSPVVTVDVAQQVKNVPEISAVVNSASYTPASLVAPCSWVSIFGSNLANGIVSLAQAPLILQYVSDSQINAQIPCGLQPDAPQDIIIDIVGDQAGAQSVSQSLVYASTAPAIFTADQSGFGQAAVLWTTPSGDYVLADPNHPAPTGAVVEIYATGLGLTNPAVKEGTQAPLPAATAIQPVGVSIGNTPAQVQFAGLSPGAVGLYQVNAVIPNGISSGNSVSITINSGSSYSQPGATIAVK